MHIALLMGAKTRPRTQKKIRREVKAEANRSVLFGLLKSLRRRVPWVEKRSKNGTTKRSAVIAVDGSRAKLFTKTPEVPKRVAATSMARGPVGCITRELQKV